MHRGRMAVAAVLVAVAATVALMAPTAAGARVHRLHHVWVFVMENHSFGQILGNPQAPFLNRIARRHQVATRFYAPSHPSLPNYLAMISGSTQGCASDRCKGPYGGPTIARQLTRHGYRWQGFFEGLPKRGYLGGDHGGYIRHHNPFVYFKSVTSKPRQRRHLRRFGAFAQSLRRPPALSFIVPNDSHNMHTGSIRAGDSWLAHWVPHVQRSAAYRRGGTILIVWDEAHNDASGCCLRNIHGGRIPLLIITPHAHTRHRLRRPSTTYSLLDTLEAGFHLPDLGLAARVRPLPPPAS